jgi:glycosyltransferase involved in cell wall biosynthesis
MKTHCGNVSLHYMVRKIIIVGPAWPLRGGIANFNEALCSSFQEAGSEVEIVSFSLQYPSFLFPGKSQNENDTRPNPGLPIKALISSVNPLSWIKTARYINSQKPDYVIVRYWLPFMAMALGSVLRFLKKDIRIIALVDNAIPHEKRIGDKSLTQYFVNTCHGFVAMSKSVLDDIGQFTKSNNKRFVAHPVYNIYGNKIDKNEARHQLNIQPEVKLILFFGFIRKYKGLALLLEAIADKRLIDMNVQLLIAGEFYEDETPYRQLIEQLNISNRVILHDKFIPSNKVASYFCAADMVAQTYITATQSGVTQIAYHFGRPMLVTDVGGLAEIVPHQKAGYVVPTKADKIADAIVDFYTNNLENEMAKFVQQKAGDFSWEAMVNEIDNLYLDLKQQ